jgi:general secretion pathway protein J
LLEVLAALTLLAVLMVGVDAGIRTATRSARNGEAQTEQLDALRSTQQFVRRQLTHALAIPWARDADGHPVVFDGGAMAVRFVAPLPGYLGKLGPQVQIVRLVRDDDGLRLEVAFALMPPDGSAPQPFGHPEVLLRGIRSGGFTYRGFDRKGRPGPWRTQWSDTAHTPSLVKLDLKLADSRWPLLEVPLRVDASAINGIPAVPINVLHTATRLP